jgi:phenylacetate-CoA ligase
MPILLRLKQLAENVPEGLGRPLSNVPFTLRLGPTYWRSYKLIAKSIHSVPAVELKEQFEKLCDLVRFASSNIPFYRDFYHKAGFSADQLKTWDDWQQVPVITKSDLQGVALADRSLHDKKGLKINTGGTSGQPLDFYLDRQAFAREWAHMHYIWKARGYQPQHLKLTFRGKHFDTAKPLRYNAVHNEYVVNASVPMSQVVEAVAQLPRTSVVRWLHGYPSLVAEFAHFLEQMPEVKVAEFRSRLFGVLLGSEFPAPIYRSVIERVLSNNVVSWYGHSEMALLARETTTNVYESLPTYGYTEAVSGNSNNEHRLVCTSLHNRVHPFIRYDTGDLIEPVSRHRCALSFRITEGRFGDFVYDRQGNRHALTAIIFGRHHPVFDQLQHLQVREEAPGRVTLVVTPHEANVDESNLWEGFDLSDLDIKWSIEIVKEPVRTAAGKIRLKIDPK